MAGDFSAWLGGGGVAGDYDGNGKLELPDLDLISAAVRTANPDIKYDANKDNAVNDADRVSWVTTLKKTYIGDANLDGEFNSGDFVQVFQRGEYEDGVAGNSGWADGDWNNDTEFDSGDFVAAFQGGGFEAGPRAAVSAVPEPGSLGLLLVTGLLAARRVRRR